MEYSVQFQWERILASGGVDKTVRLWDVATGASLGDPLIGHQGAVTSLAWSSDGQLASGDSTDSIFLWSVGTSIPASRLLQDPSDTTSAAFSPTGKLLASGDSGGKIILRDGANLTYVDTLSVPASSIPSQKNLYVASLAFSPNGRILAAGMSDSTIILWNVETRRVIADLVYDPTPKQITLVNVAFSPDGRFLASSGNSGILLWDTATQEIIERLGGEEVYNFAFSPDGRTLASSVSYQLTSNITNYAVILWNVATGKVIGQFITGHKHSSINLSFSLDGRTILLVSNDGAISFWDPVTKKLINQFFVDDGAQFYQGAVFSPNRQVVAVMGGNESEPEDITISLRNVVTHELIAHPFHYRGGGSIPTFSLDGQRLILLGFFDLGQKTFFDGLIVSDVSPEAWEARACSIVNRNFTADEWKKFTDGETYHKICTHLPVDDSEIREMLIQAQSFASIGEKKAAATAYTQATQWATETSNPILNRYICWFGGIDQFAKEVLPACERAVELEPDNGIYRDSRGLVWALLGDYQAAVADFHFFVQWITGNQLYIGKPYVAERNMWLHELEIGNNPFDAKTLESIRNE